MSSIRTVGICISIFILGSSTHLFAQCTEFTGTTESSWISCAGSAFSQGKVCHGDGNIIEFSSPGSSGSLDFVYGPAGVSGPVTLSGAGRSLFGSVSFTIGFRNTPHGTDVMTENFTASAKCADYMTAGSISVGQYIHVRSDIVAGQLFFDRGCIGGSNPLPVELVSFYATASSEKITLRWVTATEVHNYGFEVQKLRPNNHTWEPIGFVPGAGMSSTPVRYSFVDEAIEAGVISYRLKQIDRDGTATLSSEVRVQPPAEAVPELAVYPSPAISEALLTFELESPQTVSVSLHDALGRTVKEVVRSEDMGEGRAFLPVSVAGFSTGYYFAVLRIAAGTRSVRFSITK